MDPALRKLDEIGGYDLGVAKSPFREISGSIGRNHTQSGIDMGFTSVYDVQKPNIPSIPLVIEDSYGSHGPFTSIYLLEMLMLSSSQAVGRLFRTRQSNVRNSTGLDDGTKRWEGTMIIEHVWKPVVASWMSLFWSSCKGWWHGFIWDGCD